jgi:alpha-glucuronidase
LRPDANEHVISLGKHDREQGKVWEDAINAHLQRRSGPQ